LRRLHELPVSGGDSTDGCGQARFMRALARTVLALLAFSMTVSGCGDDEPELTVCSEVCVSEDGTLVTCGMRYDFEGLSDALAERPDLVALLGFSEVTTCQQAESATRALD
jgi:hypothetical protein